MTARPTSEEGLAVVLPQALRNPGGPTRPGRWRRIRAAWNWALLALAAVVLWPATLGGVTGLTIVAGDSMLPTYTTGDVAVTLKMTSYHPGDVISYTVPEGQPGAGGHVIHRVLTAESGQYTTIGDNNSSPDTWVIGDSDILGKAVARVPGVGVVFTPQVLPYVVALALGGIVTVLLWSPRAGEENEDDDERNLRRSGRRR